MSYKEFTVDDIKPDDIIISTYVKPGMGSWNPTAERAVRVYYKPLGLTVTSADERSQWQNKQKCLEQIAELVNKAWNDPEFAEKLNADFQKAGPTEVLGTTCIDGGKCHHKCTDRCSRRESCVPFTDYKGPWEYPDATPAQQPLSVRMPLGEFIDQLWSADWRDNADAQHEGAKKLYSKLFGQAPGVSLVLRKEADDGEPRG